MQNWFECKVRYERNGEKGLMTKVSESYLVESLSFSEAEAKITQELKPYISGEFIISDLKRAKYNDIFSCDESSAEKWFKSKLMFITLDEASAVEKKTSTLVLVQAANLADAVSKINIEMKSSVIDYEIATVAESPILDVFRWNSDVKDEHKE